MAYDFAERGSTAEVEEGAAFAPKFDADGLVTCVATDAASGDVLMVAHMNAEALARTIESGEACRLRPGCDLDQGPAGRAGGLPHRPPRLLLSRSAARKGAGQVASARIP